MQDLQLRLGTPTDVNRMFALDCLCFRPPFRFMLRGMGHFARQSGAYTLLAERAGTLLGFLIVQIESATDSVEAYLVTLDVHPDHRRQGIANRLMTEVEGFLLSRAASTLSLHVSTENHTAIAFYERRGYLLFGRAQDYYGPGFDALLYSRRLDKPV